MLAEASPVAAHTFEGRSGCCLEVLRLEVVVGEDVQLILAEGRVLFLDGDVAGERIRGGDVFAGQRFYPHDHLEHGLGGDLG